jgi:hypothetical protein
MLNFIDLIERVRKIPYGRNSNRNDFSLVLSENKGTCSSKHAFLKDFADKNNIPNVKLFIGIYKMNESNTKIGKILTNNNIDFIPEAHCYLKIKNIPVDVTVLEPFYEKIKLDFIHEIEIESHQIIDFKVNYHQEFIKKWIIENNISFTFEEIWNLREKCIEHLSSN